MEGTFGKHGQLIEVKCLSPIPSFNDFSKFTHGYWEVVDMGNILGEVDSNRVSFVQFLFSKRSPSLDLDLDVRVGFSLKNILFNRLPGVPAVSMERFKKVTTSMGKLHRNASATKTGRGEPQLRAMTFLQSIDFMH